jgi:hypothetical protein
MNVNTVVCSQYFASLAMLKEAVERCPEALWDSVEDKDKFWQLAYHVLFYTHLYLQKSLNDFHPWAKHWQKAERLGEDTPPGKTYSKTDILEYLDYCHGQVQINSAVLDPDAPSGFDWCEFNKLELQFYNIRHLQQHTGELMERLGSRAGINVNWVMKGG